MPKDKKKPGLFKRLFGKKKDYETLGDDQQQDFGENSVALDDLSGSGSESEPQGGGLNLLALLGLNKNDDEPVDEPSESESESGPKVSFIKEMKVKKKSQSDRTDTRNKEQRRVKNAVKLDERLSAVIHAAGWSRDPAHTKAAVNKRFPKGPPIQPAEWAAITVLSADPNGAAWLEAAGMYSIQRAEAYLAGGTFRDFHMLHRGQKLVLGRMALDKNLVGTPPFWVGRSMVARDEKVDEQTREKLKGKIDEDIVEEWAKTLDETELNDDAIQAIQQGAVPNPTDKKAPVLDENQVQQRHTTATAIMRKVFVLLQAGLSIYEDGQKVDYEGPVCKALSHGGRVNVRVPMLTKDQGKDDKFALLDWLGVTEGGEMEGSGAVFERAFGTHHMTVKKDGKDGKKGTFKEDGGKIAALKSKVGKTQLYGMNLAVGGIGQKDFNGDVVLPDGAHGHLFIGFLPPTHKRDGALQVGVETTGPHAPSTVGYVHNWNSTEKTANPISSVGGLKQDKVGKERIVDLNDLGGDWMGQLTGLEQQLQGVKSQVLLGPRGTRDA